MEVLEQFRAGHEEIERLKRAAATELGRTIVTVRLQFAGCVVLVDGNRRDVGRRV